MTIDKFDHGSRQMRRSSLKGKTTSSWKPDSWQGSGTIVSCQGFVSPERKSLKNSRNGDRKNLQSKKKEKKNAGYPETQLKKLNEYLSQNPVSLIFLSNPFRSGFGFAKSIWEVFGIPKLVYLESRHLKSAAAAKLNLGCAPWNIKLWILMVLKRKVKSPSFSWKYDCSHRLLRPWYFNWSGS